MFTRKENSDDWHPESVYVSLMIFRAVSLPVSSIILKSLVQFRPLPSVEMLAYTGQFVLFEMPGSVMFSCFLYCHDEFHHQDGAPVRLTSLFALYDVFSVCVINEVFTDT